MSRLTYRISAAAAVLVLTACGPLAREADSGGVEPTGERPSPVTRSVAERACGIEAPADVEIDDMTVGTEDGVQLRAAVLGTGARGVVMLHQTNDGLCGWLPYASHLANQNFQVVVFDRRCTFGSTCVEEPAAYDFIADVQAVLGTLSGRGADRAALVGASFGGAVAIGACASLEVEACVAVSPAQFENYLGRGITANNAIGRVRTPTLIAVAPDDPSSPVDTVAALTRRALPDVVTSEVLPAGGAHGWDALVDPLDPDLPMPFSARLVAFLDQHLSKP